MSKIVYTGYWEVEVALKNGIEKRKTRYRNCTDVTVDNDKEELLSTADGKVITLYTTTITIRREVEGKRND